MRCITLERMMRAIGELSIKTFPRIKLTDDERELVMQCYLPLVKHGVSWECMISAFPGLQNGEDEVNGAELIQWISKELRND